MQLSSLNIPPAPAREKKSIGPERLGGSQSWEQLGASVVYVLVLCVSGFLVYLPKESQEV